MRVLNRGGVQVRLKGAVFWKPPGLSGFDTFETLFVVERMGRSGFFA